MNATKSVRVSPETHRALTALGRKNETYGEIINRLLDHYIDAPAQEAPQ